jgi:hypothetical protein
MKAITLITSKRFKSFDGSIQLGHLLGKFQILLHRLERQPEAVRTRRLMGGLISSLKI